MNIILKIGGLFVISKAGYVGFNMTNFQIAEFRTSLPFLSFGLLKKLQDFRTLMNETVIISPARGSMIRWDYGRESQHNYGRAIDIMLPSGNFKKGFEKAIEAGFTGIGLYPFTTPYPMIHLDIRKTDKVATWSAIRKDEKGQWIYGGVYDAFPAIEEKSAFNFLNWLGGGGSES